jgi:hypothetical protein
MKKIVFKGKDVVKILLVDGALTDSVVIDGC